MRPYLIWICLASQFKCAISFCRFSKSYSAKRSSTHLRAEFSEEEYQQAIEIARKNDAEWLARILDYNAMYNSSNINRRSGTNTAQGASPAAAVSSPSSRIPNELIELGYSDSEVSRLKPTVRKILLEKRIKRPKLGLPTEWLLMSEREEDPNKKRGNSTPISASRTNIFSDMEATELERKTREAPRANKPSNAKQPLRQSYRRNDDDDDDDEEEVILN